MDGCWIISKTFSSSIEMIKCFLSLFLLICYITFNYFTYVEPPLHPWVVADLIMVCGLFNMLLNLV
jgi:hypothetical protein